ncbi:C69 family dipeptidase [Bifidobacterium cuniculi]|uniref:Dipeptidase n=1 Tax=Bifidobacterium cuniculi TaxID=1688 RepID=A0A087B2M8_9BIFI|nr:C69 family dipeptidase [Bifidobacterium cuniculi]KFI65278.1 dipeptidase [Bifidobacterium cuniculi]
MSCTTLIVGKAASYDGSTIIARNDDSGSGKYDPKHFVVIAPADQPREYHSVISHMTLDLPDDPCRYSIVPDVLPNRGVLAESGVNEHNVAMSATETIAVNPRVLAADPFVAYDEATGTPGGIGEEDIITIVLPYVRTAREGVERLGALLAEVGTYESNGIIFSDADEVWYMETIGGHHWMARRLPDDCYAAIPNQLGIDGLDLDDAYSERRNSMCSPDLRDFIDEHHLDRTLSYNDHSPSHFDPRASFGTATPKDEIYNTPRAWFMQRHLNPSEDWDSPDAPYGPNSQDLPWARQPEYKVTIEDVAFLMGSHFQGTDFDPYGTTGTAESRHRYRPIGVNRTGQMTCMQIRPWLPEAYRSVMWISFGCGTFTAPAPFYANVTDTPAYLRDTPGKDASTDSLYWTNRMVAVMADAHWFDTDPLVEQYIEDVQVRGHELVEHTDRSLAEDADALADDAQPVALDAVRVALGEANQEMATWLQRRTQDLLNEVLLTASNGMNNAFRMSDHWTK